MQTHCENKPAAAVSAESLVEAALAIAARRRETLVALRAALVENDHPKALRLARQLCGLHDETGNRAN